MDVSIFTSGTMLFHEPTSGSSYNPTFSTGTAANSDIIAAASQATLSELSVSPSSGIEYTWFTFRVKFTDPSNNTPAYIDLVVSFENENKSTPYQMKEEPASRKDYISGCYYTRLLQLVMGNIAYYVACHDANNDELTSATSIVIVTDHDHSTSSEKRPVSGSEAGFILIMVAIFEGTPILLTILYHRKKKSVGSANHAPNPAESNLANNSISNSTRHASNQSANQPASSNPSVLLVHHLNHLTTNTRIPPSAFIPVPSSVNSPTLATIETEDEKYLAMQEPSRAFIMPRADPSILVQLETWTEKDLAMLDQSLEDNMSVMEEESIDPNEQRTDKAGILTPVPVNVLIVDEVAYNTYKLIPNGINSFAPKIQLTYVDPATTNKILPCIEYLETMPSENISQTGATSDDDGCTCTLQLCHAKSELVNLIPLRTFLAIHTLF